MMKWKLFVGGGVELWQYSTTSKHTLYQSLGRMPYPWSLRLMGII